MNHKIFELYKILKTPITASSVYNSSSDNAINSGSDLQARIASLLVKLNQAVCSEIGKSLFVRHRRVFAFLLATRIQQQAGYISSAEWNALMSSAAHRESLMASRDRKALAPSVPQPQELAGLISWSKVIALDNLIHGLVHSFSSYPDQWRQFIESNDYSTGRASMPLPDGWDDKVTVFQRLLVLLATSEHKVMPEIYDFINKQLGVQFNFSEPLELDRALIASAPLTPIIILTPLRNVDTLTNLSKFVHEQAKSDKFMPISLGDDAERLNQPVASTLMLSQAFSQGHWVFIHHIYRNPTWLYHVEHLLDNASSSSTAVAAAAAAALSTSVLGPKSNPAANSNAANLPTTSLHSEFRLWLHCVEHLDTTMPVSLLQKGIKVAIEQPATIRTILAQIYNRMDERLFSSASKKMAPLFRRLVFVACFFHACVLVRTQYEAELKSETELQSKSQSKLEHERAVSSNSVSEHDLALAIETIRTCVAEADERNEEVSFPMLQYTIAEVIYGGHASATWDLNSLKHLLIDLLSPLSPLSPQERKIQFSGDDKFHLPTLPPAYATPPETALGLEAFDYQSDLRGLPLYDSSTAVGLGKNVTRMNLQRTARNFLDDLATLSDNRVPTQTPSSFDFDQTLTGIKQLLGQVNTQSAKEIPVVDGESLMMLAVRQELKIVNSLLDRVAKDVHLLESVGLSGSITALALRDELRENRIPAAWEAHCQVQALPSRAGSDSDTVKPLAWLSHIVERWCYFKSWLQTLITPTPILLNHFTAPKSVFSGVVHEYSCKKAISLDKITLEYNIYTSTNPLQRSASIALNSTIEKTPPVEGVIISGLYMMGAKWNDDKKTLEPTESSDPSLQSVFVSITSIHCYATEGSSAAVSGSTQAYACPVFKGWAATQSALITHIPFTHPSDLPASCWSKCAVRLLALDDCGVL